MTKCDVAIIGAGPYGLSATAHLRKVKGLDVHTFGEPMSFWERKHADGHVAPFGLGSIAYCRPEPVFDPGGLPAASSNHFSSPVPLDPLRRPMDLWYQRQRYPTSIDGRLPASMSHARGFRPYPRRG